MNVLRVNALVSAHVKHTEENVNKMLVLMSSTLKKMFHVNKMKFEDHDVQYVTSCYKRRWLLTIELLNRTSIFLNT